MKLSSDKHHLWKLSAAFSSSPCTCGWLTRFPRSSNVIVFSLIVAVRICLLEYVIHSDTHMNQRPRSILLKLRDPLAITSMGHGSKNLTFGLCHFILFQMNQWNHSGTPWSTHVFDAIFSHDLDRSWPWWVMAKVTGRKSPFEVSANHLHVEIVVKCEILMKQTGNRNLQWKGQMWWVYRNGSSNVCIPSLHIQFRWPACIVLIDVRCSFHRAFATGETCNINSMMLLSWYYKLKFTWIQNGCQTIWTCLCGWGETSIWNKCFSRSIWMPGDHCCAKLKWLGTSTIVNTEPVGDAEPIFLCSGTGHKDVPKVLGLIQIETLVS